MNELKQILIDRQVKIVLKKFFAEDYETVSEQKKEDAKKLILPRVEIDVEKMLNDYVIYIQAISPNVHNKKTLSVIFAIINITLTVGLAYSVNIENWVLVTILAVINITSLIGPLFLKN